MILDLIMIGMLLISFGLLFMFVQWSDKQIHR